MTNVTKDIFYIGVNDHDLDLFEGQYIVPLGMAYNSYVILDEKIAVMDSVDRRFGGQWITNLEEALSGRTPDYLIVQHMEPDHSANIALFMEKYPGATVVASAKAFTMMKNFYGTDYADRRLVAAEGTELVLGAHVLQFIAAPMVHWPEVLMTYDRTDGILFSADAFGKFGALDTEDPEGWACEARRYYFGIVGKYGAQAQAVLKKAAALDIRVICPLHGPVLKENLDYYLGLYNTWTAYDVETEGVAVFYTSVYGNTTKAVEILEEKLKEKGCPKVAVSDLARDDMAECVEDAFRYGRIILATTRPQGRSYRKRLLGSHGREGHENPPGRLQGYRLHRKPGEDSLRSYRRKHRSARCSCRRNPEVRSDSGISGLKPYEETAYACHTPLHHNHCRILDEFLHLYGIRCGFSSGCRI